MNKYEGVSAPFIDGWFAQEEGVDLGYKSPFDEETQWYSHTEWLSGWRARYIAVKNGEELIYD